jgi:hypothetical protein
MRSFSRTIPGLLAIASLFASPLARAALPTVPVLSVDSVVLGQSVILHAEVADTDEDLDFVTFQVSGPGVSGWSNLGNVNVSGTHAAANVVWLPPQTGVYTLRVVVHDLSGTTTQDQTFEIYSGRIVVPEQTIASGVNRMYQNDGEIATVESTSGAKVVVQAGGNFILWSGGRVTLKPGFHAQAGSFFWAAVDHNMNGYSDLEETTDTDGDGIPDAWEVDHGMNPINASDAAADRDGDGLTNLQEYQQGRDIDKKDNPVVGFAIFTPAT